MRRNWIILLVIAVVLLAGLYLSGPIRGPAGEVNQQPAPHAIDQTPSQ